MELAGTARTSVALDVDYHLDPPQMRRQRAAVRAALASPGGLLGRRCLLGRRERGGFDLLGLFQSQPKLILRQGLGPAAEAVPLQLLDDLAQALDLRFPRDQHRLKRLGVSGKLWRERGHDADSIIFVRCLRELSACRDRCRRPLRFMDPAPVQSFEKGLKLGRRQPQGPVLDLGPAELAIL